MCAAYTIPTSFIHESEPRQQSLVAGGSSKTAKSLFVRQLEQVPDYPLGCWKRGGGRGSGAASAQATISVMEQARVLMKNARMASQSTLHVLVKESRGSAFGWIRALACAK